MKQNAFIKSAVLAGSALFAGFAFAGESSPKAVIAPSSDLDVTFGVGYTNEYVFRSWNRGDDLFEASIGVSGSGSLPGLGDVDLSAGLWIGTWTTQVIDRSQGQGPVIGVNDTPGIIVPPIPTRPAGAHEMRINMQASKALSDNLNLAVGVTNYSFFGAALDPGDWLEPYIALSTQLAGLDVGVGIYWDESDNGIPAFVNEDYYLEITAGRSVDLGGLGLCVHGVLGTFNEFDDTFYGVSVGLPIAASDSITVTPHVSAIFGDTASDGDQFTAGVNLNFGF